jgi:hypothetical protein
MKSLLPLVALASLSGVSLAQTGIVWSGPTGGTLGGSTVAVSGFGSASIIPYDLSGPEYAAAPLSASQDCIDYNGNSNWSATFTPAISSLTWYGKYIRGANGNTTGAPVDYTFNHPFTIISGFGAATVSGNTLSVPASGFHHGILQFSGSIALLTSTTTNTEGHFQASTLGENGGGGGNVTVVCDPANTHTQGSYTKLDNSILGPPGGALSGLHLEATDGPAGEFGYFLVSSGASASLAISNGILCLDSPQGRYAPAAGVSALNSIGAFDASGTYQSSVQGQQGWNVPIGLPSPPGGTITAGDTWYFQMWYRDGQRSNFSNAIRVQF